jgi:hypothetical protein
METKTVTPEEAENLQKNQQKNDVSVINQADLFLNEVKNLASEANKNSVKIVSAVVSSVNSNGSVDIYFPPDDGSIFTNIKNQTPFLLAVGDSVEILEPQGNPTNCWICAKHTDTPMSALPNLSWVII